VKWSCWKAYITAQHNTAQQSTHPQLLHEEPQRGKQNAPRHVAHEDAQEDEREGVLVRSTWLKFLLRILPTATYGREWRQFGGIPMPVMSVCCHVRVCLYLCGGNVTLQSL
jgi:hypothetical protein